MQKLAHADLATRHTLAARATANEWIELDSAADIRGAIASAAEPTLICGAGSNTLFVGDFPGTIIHPGWTSLRSYHDDDTLVVEAGPANDWPTMVRELCAEGWWGIENLAGIPGSTAAAPIQNIGAYGVELADVFLELDAFDRHLGDFVTLTRKDCRFGYRDSRFKREPGRFVITAVRLQLSKQGTPKRDYPGVADAIAEDAHPKDIAQAIETIRAHKLPDPKELPNAGSFFKNPIVAQDTADVLRRKFPELPLFPVAEQQWKLSAGWLIEQAGFRGARTGDAGMAAQHALVLVNHGKASGKELFGFAMHVRDTVEKQFGIELEPEPQIVRGH